MVELPSVGPDQCGAPGGPRGVVCQGPVGHPGPHGAADDRWTDELARRYQQVPEVPQEPASGPLTVFRGHVRCQDAHYRGVVTLLDGWVHVELVGDQRQPLPDGCSAVLLPDHAVLAIDVAREQADRA